MADRATMHNLHLLSPSQHESNVHDSDRLRLGRGYQQDERLRKSLYLDSMFISISANSAEVGTHEKEYCFELKTQ